MVKKKKNGNGNGKVLSTQQSMNAAVWSICNILRRSNLAGALQYVPELSWILFLRILDEREQLEAEEADAISLNFTPSLQSPYRWRDWAAPYDDKAPPGSVKNCKRAGSSMALSTSSTTTSCRTCAHSATPYSIRMPRRARRLSAKSCQAFSTPALIRKRTCST
jgi:hypothetical protein